MKADYTYLDDGKKITAVNANDSGYEYLGSFVYSRNNNVISLESASFNGGRIEKASNGFEINYFITDQLGSTRAMVNQNMVTSSNRYTYNGKEDQNFFDLEYLDYGARFYDPELGRFHTVDPLSEKYYHASPFAYVENNPISRIDPDGRDWKISSSTDEDGVDFYCIDDYVYAHIEDNGGKLLIPVVYKLNDSIIKLPCIEYSKWVKEMYKG